MIAGILRGSLVAALLAAAALAVSPAPAGAEPATLTLVTTNDLDRMAEKDGRGGLARLAAVVAAERARGTVLFLHAGDALSPSLLSGFDQGRHMVELLNLLEPDVFVPGNHEFDFGPAVFAERLAEAEFPVVAANLRAPSGELPEGVLESRLLTLGGLKVGIVGVMLDDVSVRSTPGAYGFLPPLEVAEAVAARLRGEGAELLVAVAHTPLEEDLELLRSGRFDVVVSGDDHLLTLLYDGRSLLVEAGEQADRVPVVTLSVERDERGLRWTPSFRVVDTADVAPDPAVAERIAGYEAELSQALDDEIGATSTALDSRRIEVRSRETTIGNLFADAMREMTGADVALLNGGGIRGNKVYPAGSRLSARDILTELPFGNRTVLIELTGLQLRAALENGFSGIEEGSGRFPQLSGMTVAVDTARSDGARVVEAAVNGLPLDPQARYTLATNDFLARGGDGYGMLTQARTIVSADEAGLMASQVIAYIRSIGYVAPQIEGRIQLR